ncbi:MAG: amidophosphoribosyltransferase [Kiritimatiellae bacterium]|jgi:amidophosphoribosyltransferase|nr:amidophosphoribosyltransferase [Kiritimatiellia bacterium]
MGGFCGVISEGDCVSDLFYATDYHSHLGTHRGGMAVLGEDGFSRAIHNIQNSPFRSEFESDVDRFAGKVGVGVISDTDPQPLVMFTRTGSFAIVAVGLISNLKELEEELFATSCVQLQYSTTSRIVGPTEVISALIATKDSLVEGVKYVQKRVQGSCSILIVTGDGHFYAIRDRYGRTPVVIGKKDGAMIAVQESCALLNLGYDYVRDLGPGEMVELSPDGETTLIEPGPEMAICSFLWVYYGFPASSYEGRNVEMARYRSGSALAKRDDFAPDVACGIPDSGTSHALGYAHEKGVKYSRPFVKYTPTWARSFMPSDQKQRERVASMKLIPIPGLIRNRKLVFCDDSIVRGTQLAKQADRLYTEGCSEVNVRIACPPLLFPCKFINFSRSKNEYDLITRRYIRDKEGEGADVSKYIDSEGAPYKEMVEYIRSKLNLTSLKFQTVDDLVAAIGLPKDRLCTYCWTGKDVSLKDGCSGACASCPCCGSGDKDAKAK